MRTRLTFALALALAACGEINAPAAHPVGSVQRFASDTGELEVTTVAAGLEHPWGLAILPDGGMLVTERPGRLRWVEADGSLSAPIEGLPTLVASGQGGLLDVAVDPDFANTRWIYLSFAEPGRGGIGTAVARGRLVESTLRDVEVIFSQQPKVGGGHHFGSRLVFDRHGRLFVSSGDRQVWPHVQALDKGQGKVFRIERDGGIPSGNPFADRADAQPAIWSLGHRNVQGAALHPVTGELWLTEHGPRGGDELNIARAGRNYGWPLVTYGINYDGTPVGDGHTELPGTEPPLHHWTPSIAPSGLAFYTHERFPEWQGSLFVGALAYRLLVRLELDGERVRREERLLTELGERIRDVRQGPDGYLYLLTDAPDGRILRVGLAPRITPTR